MMQQKQPPKKLSKAVLDLKFMKKSKEKAIVQKENEERQQLYQDQLSSLHEGAEKIVMLNSYVDCLKFLPCRLSFGGMDPEIDRVNEDKLMGLYKIVKLPPKEAVTEMDADISAKEMLSQYRKRNHPQGEETYDIEGEQNQQQQQEVYSSPAQATKKKGKQIHHMLDLEGGSEMRKRKDNFNDGNTDYRGDHRGGFRGGDRGHFKGSRKGNFRGGNRGHFKGDNKHSNLGSSRGKFKGRRGESSTGYKWKDFRGENTRGGSSGDSTDSNKGQFRGGKINVFQGKRDINQELQGRDGEEHKKMRVT